MTGFAIIGAGFVADLYMGSLKLYPEIPIRGVFDRRPERAAAQHLSSKMLPPPPPGLRAGCTLLPAALPAAGGDPSGI